MTKAEAAIYLALGSNKGNRLANLLKAIDLLKSQGFKVSKQSIILETTAILPASADINWDRAYLNMVISGTTKLSPEQLLVKIKAVEKLLGRAEIYEKWCPRIIDIDIILWSDQNINSVNLTIPHTELLNRPFLLHLIAMLDSSLSYQGKTFGEIAHYSVDLQSCFSKSFTLNPKLVGVVNITPDSFSDGNLYLNPQKAIQKILELSEEGATIIDIGAQSTRPGAIMLNPSAEWERLKPVLDEIATTSKNGYDCAISIDSFHPEVIRKAIKNYAIAWVNDVKGDLDNSTLSYIADHNCKIVVMHSKSIPPTKQNCIDFNIPPLQTISYWAEKVINKLKNCGFTEKQIILDPGIGFGKSAYQNFSLLQSASELKKFGCAILVGHSRKSYINAFYHSKAASRDLETIAISAKLHDMGVDYLRVHNIKDHQRFFVAQQAIYST